jgi:hypothetical protein
MMGELSLISPELCVQRSVRGMKKPDQAKARSGFDVTLYGLTARSPMVSLVVEVPFYFFARY